MWVQKISILPLQKGLEFPGGEGFCKTKKFKEMYADHLESPEGWGGGRGGGLHIAKNDSMCGGMAP